MVSRRTVAIAVVAAAVLVGCGSDDADDQTAGTTTTSTDPTTSSITAVSPTTAASTSTSTTAPDRLAEACEGFDEWARDAGRDTDDTAGGLITYLDGLGVAFDDWRAEAATVEPDGVDAKRWEELLDGAEAAMEDAITDLVELLGGVPPDESATELLRSERGQELLAEVAGVDALEEIDEAVGFECFGG